MGTIQRLDGTNDLPPGEWRRLSIIQARLETFLDRRGYDVVSTPVLENTELFLRKSGGELAAQMYSFVDPSGRRVSLRPEFTASIVRGFLDGSFSNAFPVRLQYSGTVFRYGINAPGPREFIQFGAEVLGANVLAADAEIIAFAAQSLTALGVEGHGVRVGNLGVVTKMLESLNVSERARGFLIDNLSTIRQASSGSAIVRQSAEKLGLLGVKVQSGLNGLAQRLKPTEAGKMVEGFLSETVTGPTGQRTLEEVFQRYLRKLKESEDPKLMKQALAFVEELVNIAGPATEALPELTKLAERFQIDPQALEPVQNLVNELNAYDLGPVPVVIDLGIARGLAYYTGTVFELEHQRINGLPPLGGGGRYDGLARALGGAEDLPTLGYALALDRVSELLPSDFGEDEPAGSTRVLVVASESTMEQAVKTAERLRAQGISAELDIVSRTETDASRYANERGITTVMRVGQDGSTEEQSYT